MTAGAVRHAHIQRSKVRRISLEAVLSRKAAGQAEGRALHKWVLVRQWKRVNKSLGVLRCTGPVVLDFPWSLPRTTLMLAQLRAVPNRFLGCDEDHSCFAWQLQHALVQCGGRAFLPFCWRFMQYRTGFLLTRIVRRACVSPSPVLRSGLLFYAHNLGSIVGSSLRKPSGRLPAWL